MLLVAVASSSFSSSGGRLLAAAAAAAVVVVVVVQPSHFAPLQLNARRFAASPKGKASGLSCKILKCIL